MRDASFDLAVSDLGACRVRDGRIEPPSGQSEAVDLSVATDRDGLFALAAGVSPLKLMLSGRIRVRGSRRRLAAAGGRLRAERAEPLRLRRLGLPGCGGM